MVSKYISSYIEIDLDWKQFYLRQLVASQREANTKTLAVSYLMYLYNAKHLTKLVERSVLALLSYFPLTTLRTAPA